MLGSIFSITMDKKKITLNYVVSSTDAGDRVDQISAREFDTYSRAHIQKWIKDGVLLVNNQTVKAKQNLEAEDVISVNFWETPNLDDQPENIPLDVVHEDDDILIINKPAGLVVHPGSGNMTGTLMNGLLFLNKKSGFLPRAGIVHRLDRDTSGLMVVAKTEPSYLNLVSQLKERSVRRTYFAIVLGSPVSNKVINEPIGRHPTKRTKQAVNEKGKEAITRISVEESFAGYSLLKVNLETGRTHQIRVHLSHIGHPIVGDSTYGGRKKFAPGSSDLVLKKIADFKRQALHAAQLELTHPSTNKAISFESEIPSDMRDLMSALKNS